MKKMTITLLTVLCVTCGNTAQAEEPLCYELAVAQAEMMITEFGEPNNEFIEDLANEFYNNPLINCK